MSAQRLTELLTLGLAEHDEIEAVRLTTTIFMDRLALSVTDPSGLTWRIYILSQPREAVAS